LHIALTGKVRDVPGNRDFHANGRARSAGTPAKRGSDARVAERLAPETAKFRGMKLLM